LVLRIINRFDLRVQSKGALWASVIPVTIERVLRLHAQIGYKLRFGYKRVPLRMLVESPGCCA
jgi:hypothetical protein